MSIPSCITLRTVKGSVLSWAELDNNFVCLNNLINSKSGTGGNQFHIPSGDTVTVFTDYQYFFYGDIFIEGTLELMAGSQLVVLNGDIITGGTGTITGTGDIYNIDLPEFDTKVTGMTYSGNVITVYQNDGSTYSSVITTTDIRVSGLTYSGNVLTLSQTDGSEFNVTIPQFTGNTSGDCITDIYVSNVNSCSPLHIQPNSNGDVLIGENGGVNVGIGTTTPNAKLGIKGIDTSSSNYGLKVQNSGGTNNFVVRNDGATITNNSMFFNKLNQFQSLVAGDTIGTFNDNISIAAGIQTPSTNRFRLSYYGDTQWLTAIDIQNVIGDDVYGNLLFMPDGGNVGIGTSTPSEKLEVVGKTKTTNFQMSSGATTGYILTSTDSNGNGKWSPVSGITGIGNVTKYTTNLTFTDSETKTITHNLNTKFVHCSVWDTSTNELITPQVVRVTGSETTSLYITISTGGNYDILITG